VLEQYGFIVLAVGAVAALAAFAWLVVRAFRASTWWGVALLMFPPAALVFIPLHFRQVRGPALLLGLAGLVVATPYALAYYERNFVVPPPHEAIVDGELRITLTGVKDYDYALLRGRSDVIVLQMANEDVTDGTLEHLRGLTGLHRLDVGNSQVTDAGLAVIATLPALAELNLARTKITDEGFQAHLAAKESLEKLDLTGTPVKGKSKRDWKNRRPETRDYVD